MLRTTSLVSSINEVPRAWVFEHYLQLTEKLTGQDVRLKSIFNPKDKKPSFFVYYSTTKRRYLFKDFSTDDSGDGTALVMKMFNLSTRGETAHKIIEDYNKEVLTNGKAYAQKRFKLKEKYKVTSHEVRKWTRLDQKFWTRFKIGSSILEFFIVKPLRSYTLSKTEDGETRELIMSGNRMYGYFRLDGTLYKIYQPASKEGKFIKVEDYIQGTDQLTFKTPYLVICSSLKDMAAFKALGFTNAETVAPDSENILIPKHVIGMYKLKYKGVCTLLDNDPAGIKAMKKYQEEYNIPPVHLKLEKDLADCNEQHGIETTRVQLYPVLTKALTGKAKQL